MKLIKRINKEIEEDKKKKRIIKKKIHLLVGDNRGQSPFVMKREEPLGNKAYMSPTSSLIIVLN